MARIGWERYVIKILVPDSISRGLDVGAIVKSATNILGHLPRLDWILQESIRYDANAWSAQRQQEQDRDRPIPKSLLIEEELEGDASYRVRFAVQYIDPETGKLTEGYRDMYFDTNMGPAGWERAFFGETSVYDPTNQPQYKQVGFVFAFHHPRRMY